jgi:hypothetical protein
MILVETVLSSTALSERYKAVKALRRSSGARVAKALLARVTQTEEHIFVCLETAAGLARQGREEEAEALLRR